MAPDDPGGADPRLDPRRVRRLPGPDGEGDVVLVGVVHDHPASVHRVRRVVSDATPTTIALELPPLALPLFRHFAGDGSTPPRRGGEMSAAIQAAETLEAANTGESAPTRVVGIDAVDRSFLRTLLGTLREERASLATIRKVAAFVYYFYRRAVLCRVAALVARLTGVVLPVDAPVKHDCGPDDPPAAQAKNEASQISTRLALLRAAHLPPPVKFRDETRETCMARRLRDLRREGDVVAVVGVGHLDGLVARLDSAD